ncbi:hypothetical protein HanPSC8_Chr10g0408141 [Helianthus annuus]|nr:hypothetical protein HanPSC8_Chr10g0408141 [Helianthus annuus]
MSVDGFQSGSKMMTLLAPVKFVPSPPTLVVKINIKISSELLNSSIKAILCFTGVNPSIRLYV